jgi:ribosomal protein S21
VYTSVIFKKALKKIRFLNAVKKLKYQPHPQQQQKKKGTRTLRG